MKRYFLIIFLWVMFPVMAQAAIVSQLIDYRDGDKELQGYLVYDDATEDQRPGVIVVHDWMGFGDYGNWRAEELAKLGYIAFAIDMYGKDSLPKDTKEASTLAGMYKSDRTLMRERAKAGYDVLKAHPLTDPTRMAAIGYCFGGTVVLEMARAGFDLKGVASFHGGLDSPSPSDGRNITGSVLVLHGADDPFESAEDLAAFKKEMKDAGVDLRFVAYQGAVHSFTQKKADEDDFEGTAYNEAADRNSWERMKGFFDEIFTE